jgi:hypothetical protein
VDRIDVEQIRICPHQKKARPEKRFGVVVFVHEDGEPCSLLNSLRLGGDALNKEDVRLTARKGEVESMLDLLDDPACYARLVTDRDMLTRLAKELDGEKSKQRLEKAFIKIAKEKNAVEVFEGIASVLGPSARDVVINNVAAVYAKMYQQRDVPNIHQLYPLISEYAKKLAEKKGGQKHDEGSP